MARRSTKVVNNLPLADYEEAVASLLRNTLPTHDLDYVEDVAEDGSIRIKINKHRDSGELVEEVELIPETVGFLYSDEGTSATARNGSIPYLMDDLRSMARFHNEAVRILEMWTQAFDEYKKEVE